MSLSDEQVALLVRQRDAAWAALREPAGSVATAYANALGTIATLNATIAALNADLAAQAVTIAEQRRQIALLGG